MPKKSATPKGPTYGSMLPKPAWYKRLIDEGWAVHASNSEPTLCEAIIARMVAAPSWFGVKASMEVLIADIGRGFWLQELLSHDEHAAIDALYRALALRHGLPLKAWSTVAAAEEEWIKEQDARAKRDASFAMRWAVLKAQHGVKGAKPAARPKAGASAARSAPASQAPAPRTDAGGPRPSRAPRKRSSG